MATALALTLALSSLTTPVFAEDNWYPSKYGADDTLGAMNELSEKKTKLAAQLVKTGKTYALGVETGPTSPAYPPRSYSMTILQLDDGMGTPLGSNKATGNDDLMHIWMGIGSQIDGLGHMGVNHQYYNGHMASDFVTPSGLTKLSIDRLPPVATRGVLLDIAKLMKTDILPAGTAFNKAEIDAAAKAAGITIEAGDVVLFHTGWLNVMDSDPEAFMASAPGLGLEGARYLASLGVVAVGADTWALEVLPSEDATMLFPVHPELLAKNGIYILENMDTRALAADNANEFLFVLGTPRFVGAVQAVINPVAIR
ncbi:MAG: cyclase family protein [Gammaproteobacteria bacterium]|nr:cyclase family protein [Gammaproteobacteria bacterium]MBT3694411.1 cyclase family protein [Gammaproteobacteria bacterium]MBT5333631.1 cyclase family protein [Gammaproteobacteria bacterium]MBT5681125.1 cyclase family protein [Gammaproteobacteria bacterium]MBT6024142.1 cyclase family protein [Gammaproteobacteria bacterium]